MSARRRELGPVIAAVEGMQLELEDRERLTHPLVGGVTLFSRNYAEPAQLATLCAEIHALREPRLLVCVDHEGGRVQRFREGFTTLPPMRALGVLWDSDEQRAREAAHAIGLVIAAELRACGVDLSFAPVLDLDHGASSIIGDRALHRKPDAVSDLAACLLDGLRAGGMAGVGKHFPGHGWIAADSHLELPVDDRELEAIRTLDLAPFRALAARLEGIMPAHVLYPRVDAQPAGFSRRWIESILRQELGFTGAVLSDDLGMAGAACAGPLEGRAHAAFEAGCDLVLACTALDADALIARLRYDMPRASRERLRMMFGATGGCPVDHGRVADARARIASLDLG